MVIGIIATFLRRRWLGQVALALAGAERVYLLQPAVVAALLGVLVLLSQARSAVRSACPWQAVPSPIASIRAGGSRAPEPKAGSHPGRTNADLDAKNSVRVLQPLHRHECDSQTRVMIARTASSAPNQ